MSIKSKNNNYDKVQNLIIILVIVIILFGVFIRFYKIDTIPPGLYHDEAYNGLDAILTSSNGEYKLVYPDNNLREGLFINTIAILFLFFGKSVWTLRALSAFFGSLTLIGFYLLAREFNLSRLAALTGLIMFTVSFWHINFSRIAYRGILVPFLLVWVGYFFYAGINKNKYLPFLFSGILLGIGIHTYIAFRFVPIIFLVVIIYSALSNPGWLKLYWKKLIIFFTAVLLISLPLIIYFFIYPAEFLDYTIRCSIFNHPSLNTLKAFFNSFGLHILGFFYLGDPNQRHSHLSHSFIPLFWTFLLILGLIICYKIIKRHYRKKSAPLINAVIFSLGTFIIMLLPGILTHAFVPKTLRIIGILPAIFLISSLPIEYLVKTQKDKQILKLNKNVLLSIIIFFVLFFGALELRLYFFVWSKNPLTKIAFYQKYYDLGLMIYDLPRKRNNIILFNPDPKIETLTDFSMEKSKITTAFAAYPKLDSFIYIKPNALASLICDDTLILLVEYDPNLIGQIIKKCPALKLSFVPAIHSEDRFYLLSDTVEINKTN